MLLNIWIQQFIALYDTSDDFDAIIERVPMCMTGVFYFINFLTLVSQTSKVRNFRPFIFVFF